MPVAQTVVQTRAAGAHALDSFFFPRSVAIIGASPDATKIRGLLLHFLRKNGYGGQIFPVNPSYAEIDGIACFPSIGAIGAPIDLVLMAIPAGGVLAALEECAAAGVRHAVIISSGFAEEGGASTAAQHAIAAFARRTGMRISGPNAEGFHNEPGNVTATFSPTVDRNPQHTRISASERRIGIIAQSGGIGFALYNRGQAAGLNFSHVVSTGNEADLTAADFLDYMVQDRLTDVVMLFLESVRDPAGFLAAAARAAASGKPVIVAKVGRSSAGERAAVSHTASMTGWNAAYEAVFAKFGFVSTSDPDEAVAIAAAFASAPVAQGDRVGIVTVSGGAGAWAADALTGYGLRVPELSAQLQATIRAYIPSYGTPRNPVDITAQAAHTGGFQKTVDLLNESDEIDIILVVTSLASEKRVAFDPEVLKRTLDSRRKPILFHTYTLPSVFARTTLARAGVVVFPGLAAVSAAAAQLVRRGRFQPPLAPACEAALGAGIAQARHPQALPALQPPPGPYSEADTKAFLRSAGIALPQERLVVDPAELDAAMRAVGFPLAMKIQSPDIPHKSEAGGVHLGIADAAAGRVAYAQLVAGTSRRCPAARLQGVLVSPMAGKGVEMIIGVVGDAVFGPILMLGFGGVTTELFKDVAYRPAPVSSAEAAAMLAGLKAAPLLNGFRGAARSDVAALLGLVVQISTLAAGLQGVVGEFELNPVIVHPEGQGVTIVDALMIQTDSKSSPRS